MTSHHFNKWLVIHGFNDMNGSITLACKYCTVGLRHLSKVACFVSFVFVFFPQLRMTRSLKEMLKYLSRSFKNNRLNSTLVGLKIPLPNAGQLSFASTNFVARAAGAPTVVAIAEGDIG